MFQWQSVLIRPDDSIQKAMQVIDASAVGVAMVTDDAGHLLGTATDGDIRRAILKGCRLTDSVSGIMNSRPVTAGPGDDGDAILRLMRRRNLEQIPVVDGEGKILRIEFLHKILRQNRRDNPAVIMAGGLGVRLRPLTENCPKPMLPVGGRPMLETILESLMNYGFHRFWLAVNYKAEMIEEYFGDGSRWGVEILYLREERKLGTAGALGLLPERPEQPLLIMNGDVLTKANFTQLMDFQELQQAEAVMCVREYEVKIPFGVVETENGMFLGVAEKPEYNYFINAGVYVLAPTALDLVVRGECLDMPTLFSQLAAAGRKTMVHPLTDFWLDVGRHGDLARAESEMGFL